MDPNQQNCDRLEPRSTPQTSDNRSDVRSDAELAEDGSKEKEPETPPGAENNCEIEDKKKAEIDELCNKVRIEKLKVATVLSGAGIARTLQRAQDKNSTAPKRKLTAESTDDGLFKDNSDDDLPVATVAQIAEANPFLTDRKRRDDLILVKNKDNNGSIFIGDRPFWHGHSDGDDMPQTERRTFSQICKELGANRAEFSKLSAIAQTGNRSVFDAFLSKEKMEERNKMYYSQKQIEVNTIVTIIQTLHVDKEKDTAISTKSVTSKTRRAMTREQSVKQCTSASKTKKKTRIIKKPEEKKPLNVGTITEPTTAISYKKYEIKKREVVAFNRTGMGVCKKPPKKGIASAQASDSSTSSSSIKSNKDETPQVVVKKQAFVRKSMSKKN